MTRLIQYTDRLMDFLIANSGIPILALWAIGVEFEVALQVLLILKIIGVVDSHVSDK